MGLSKDMVALLARTNETLTRLLVTGKADASSYNALVEEWRQISIGEKTYGMVLVHRELRELVIFEAYLARAVNEGALQHRILILSEVLTEECERHAKIEKDQKKSHTYLSLEETPCRDEAKPDACGDSGGTAPD